MCAKMTKTMAAVTHLHTRERRVSEGEGEWRLGFTGGGVDEVK